MEGLKLFVVGEISADPDKWGVGTRSLVIAHDEKEAMELAELGPAVEIPFLKPMVLTTEDIPDNL